jgi:SAM-dependent methyltransferase
MLSGSALEKAMEKKDDVRRHVRDAYAKIARTKSENSGCACGPTCCSPQSVDVKGVSAKLGYSSDELAGAPEDANMGLGCGNPQAVASLTAGEVVLDLGCGGGFDCFLAARRVGSSGRVIGVDMTPEMILKAREIAKKGNYANVEFRLGEIEHLPVADNSVDVIISNCVVNLSPDKPQVYRDAYRVLKPGGRIAFSDIVAVRELPEKFKGDVEKLSGCVAGAATADELTTALEKAGFTDIQLLLHEESRSFIKDWFPGTGVEDYVVSASIQAEKSVY